ncbi:MAG: sialidase family protein, partial [Kiritimatiellia bacterium]|nr:sialidase family protein [Kiritimatiellia bacterium]
MSIIKSDSIPQKTKGPENIPDSRHIATGWEIPTVTYCDQPYIVQTNDGAWLCCVTTGSGDEGVPGQFVLAMRSKDRGQTWSDYVAVEPPDGPEASYAVMLKVPDTGRIYIFFNHNTDNVREVLTEPGYETKSFKRVDSLGHFVFKYSDDHGKSWSHARYEIPIRDFQCDRANVYGGKLKFFWNVGKPFILNNAAYVSLHKVGAMGAGFFAQSEGALLRSSNLLTERDPEKIVWETLPEGDVGLRTPPGGGRIAEEQSYSVMSDGSIYCVYRSVDGHPVEAYSRDGGRKWSVPRYKRYASGRLMKHPRAANFAWRCLNEKYLYWYHNHGGIFIRRDFRIHQGYEDRNPVWLCAGEEVDSPEGRVIRWSQPEIVLYDDDPFIRMSYPDLVEDGGEYYLTETQKYIARVHKVEKRLLDGLFGQFENRTVDREGLILELPADGSIMPASVPMPLLPVFLCFRDGNSKDLRAGLTLEVRFKLDHMTGGQALLDNRTPEGNGFCLQTTDHGTLELILGDGRTENRWDCDPDLLGTNRDQHVVVIVDGGPKLILFVVDGVLCDGGEHRQFGWGRYNPNLR